MAEKQQQQKIWNMQTKEPLLWYERFLGFYLPGVVNNEDSLRSAYYKFLESTGKGSVNNKIAVPADWKKAYREWNWQERAKAFKQEQVEAFLLNESSRCEIGRAHV